MSGTPITLYLCSKSSFQAFESSKERGSIPFSAAVGCQLLGVVLTSIKFQV